MSEKCSKNLIELQRFDSNKLSEVVAATSARQKKRESLESENLLQMIDT